MKIFNKHRDLNKWISSNKKIAIFHKNFGLWLSRKINYPLTSPSVIQLSLTYRCNLRCKMCTIVDLLPQEEELSTEQIFHIIDEAKDYGIGELLLTGGEPFLRKDIFKICEYANNRGLRSIITTNGLIDKPLAEQIAKSKINHIHISLDGLKETNDFFRGRGTFEKIREGIRLLEENKKGQNHFSLGIACTVMDKNIEELYELVRLAEDLNVDVINFQPLVNDNANFLNKDAHPFWPKEDDISILEEEIKKIRSLKRRHIAIYEEPNLELLPKYYQGRLTRKDWICFGGFKTVFICYSKSEPLVYSCHGICGNLNKASLKKTWMSKEAYRLRLHSKRCKDLCMQSCYSKESAQSLKNLFGSCFKKLKR